MVLNPASMWRNERPPGVSASSSSGGDGWGGGAAQRELMVTPSVTTQTLGGQEFNFFVIRIHMEANWDGILCEQRTVHYIPECLLCI